MAKEMSTKNKWQDGGKKNESTKGKSGDERIG